MATGFSAAAGDRACGDTPSRAGAVLTVFGRAPPASERRREMEGMPDSVRLLSIRRPDDAAPDAVASMHGPLYAFLADDHARLDALLRRAFDDPAHVDTAAYAAFRVGLLTHIAMEEKILLPAARRARGGEPLPIAAKLRLDHGALAALLVPRPTRAIAAAVRAILAAHNPIEEGPGGLYDTCEALAGAERDALLAQLRAAPEVRASPPVDGPRVLAAARRALERAGFDFDLEGAAPRDDG